MPLWAGNATSKGPDGLVLFTEAYHNHYSLRPDVRGLKVPKRCHGSRFRQGDSAARRGVFNFPCGRNQNLTAATVSV